MSTILSANNPPGGRAETEGWSKWTVVEDSSDDPVTASLSSSWSDWTVVIEDETTTEGQEEVTEESEETPDYYEYYYYDDHLKDRKKREANITRDLRHFLEAVSVQENIAEMIYPWIRGGERSPVGNVSRDEGVKIHLKSLRAKLRRTETPTCL